MKFPPWRKRGRINGRRFLKKISALGLLLVSNWLALPAKATSVWKLEVKHFQNPQRTVSFDLYPAHGVNIVFTPLGMTAKVVWLDDISRVGLSFDGVLCEKWLDNTCKSSDGGANVIHVTLHKDVFQICHLPKDDPDALSKSEQLECDLPEHSPDRTTSVSILLQGNGTSEFIVIDINPQPGIIPPSDRVNTIFVVPNTAPLLPQIGNLKPSKNNKQNQIQSESPSSIVTPVLEQKAE